MYCNQPSIWLLFSQRCTATQIIASKDQINFINNQLQSQTKSLRFQFEENLKLIAQLTKSQQVEVKDKFQDREDIKNIKEEINKTIDDVVEINSPKGQKSYTIKSIKYV